MRNAEENHVRVSILVLSSVCFAQTKLSPAQAAVANGNQAESDARFSDLIKFIESIQVK